MPGFGPETQSPVRQSPGDKRPRPGEGPPRPCRFEAGISSGRFTARSTGSALLRAKIFQIASGTLRGFPRLPEPSRTRRTPKHRQALAALPLAVPLSRSSPTPFGRMANKEQLEQLEQHFRNLILDLGLDPENERIRKTPARAAKAFQYLTSGYDKEPGEVIGEAVYPSHSEEMVIVRDIEVYSLCEHHLLPFFGRCHVGYLPNKHVIGLSKVARIIDLFARRVQIQENMSWQIANALNDAIKPHGIGVIVETSHLCMMMRGVEKQNSRMVTSVMLGQMRKDVNTRSEFLRLAGISRC